MSQRRRDEGTALVTGGETGAEVGVAVVAGSFVGPDPLAGIVPLAAADSEPPAETVCAGVGPAPPAGAASVDSGPPGGVTFVSSSPGVIADPP
ncbi:MAG TPA: hypothetical protein VEX41_04520 [Candidatus Eisenbacteria bacterium]|nr:hypothetical protein [Candidatus Eisenbacteria bacterium]